VDAVAIAPRAEPPRPRIEAIRIENDFFKALAFVLKHFHQVRCAYGKKSAESVVAGVCQRRSI
jgi:hypothetical protein